MSHTELRIHISLTGQEDGTSLAHLINLEMLKSRLKKQSTVISTTILHVPLQNLRGERLCSNYETNYI